MHPTTKTRIITALTSAAAALTFGGWGTQWHYSTI
jgi:hypothetical protein